MSGIGSACCGAETSSQTKPKVEATQKKGLTQTMSTALTVQKLEKSLRTKGKFLTLKLGKSS